MASPLLSFPVSRGAAPPYPTSLRVGFSIMAYYLSIATWASLLVITNSDPTASSEHGAICPIWE
jgi:hypothetical protein